MRFSLSKYRGNYVMHCSTKEQAIAFLQFLHHSGRTWRNGLSYEDETMFENYRQNTCYYFNQGEYGSFQKVKRRQYNVLEFSDFEWDTYQEQPLEESKRLNNFISQFSVQGVVK